MKIKDITNQAADVVEKKYKNLAVKKSGKEGSPEEEMSEPKSEAMAEGDAQKPKKKFIQGAIKNPGALHDDLGVAKGTPIPQDQLDAASKQPGKVGERARFAETLKKMRHG